MKAKKKEKIRVTVTSHDSWSGVEVLYTKEFVTEAAAVAFCKKFNAKNNLPQVPEYYEIATVGDGWGYAR